MVLAMTTLLAVGSPALAATTPTRVATATLPFATTNGDVLAVKTAVVGSRRLTVFGGNFSAVITPDGASHAAHDFGVVDATNGALVFAGNADSYVRAVTSLNGVVYIGGDFSHVSGATRHGVAALDAGTWQLTGWNPGAGGRVRALDASATTIFVADSSQVRAVSPAGATVWRDTGDCGINALLLSPDQSKLYLGGFFNQINGAGQHSLALVNPANGAVDPTFTPVLTHDSGLCSAGGKPAYDGENTISMTYDTVHGRLVAGQGGILNTLRSLDPVTGARKWSIHTPGDAQAVSMIGDMVFVGYHRNAPNPDGSNTNYFAQLRASKGGAPIAWDPNLTGNQGNADGGNNGVQASWFDPVLQRLYLGGSFFPPKSLAVFQAS